MKLSKNIILVSFIFLVFGCTTTGNKSVESYEYVVKLWEQLEISMLSTIVEDARNNNESWISSPALYPQHLFEFSDLKSYSIHYSVKSIELNRKSTIIVVRDGFLDDSVRGDIHEIVLEKTGEQWEIKSAKRAFRCWRSSESTTYSADTCS